ncbi:MAG: NERD domain-containing protein [Nitrosomonadales bacterium]|nr:NERD domain-containing protein [Nitrosomonadales bacterium]
MAVLIPSLGCCSARMTGGERRFAQRLENKLEDDYHCWYDVPVGPTNAHPDFVILHPRRGILILEVKDWKLEQIQSISKEDVAYLTTQGIKRFPNPLEQARHYAHAIADALKKDPQLTFSSGRMQGKLTFPWSYGVVLTNISRQSFERTDLAEVLLPHRVICQDEMTESVGVEAFQQRLWQMFDLRFEGFLSLPQIDRVRWHMFPEIRLPAKQGGLFDAAEHDLMELPDIMRVMDMQQEQLARSLGEGHRVIHGVAGSGKTLILGYRAEYLAKASIKPILILCYNKTLARRLQQWMIDKGVSDKVSVRNFHSWCRSQLATYHIDIPTDKNKEALMTEMVDCVIRNVDRKLIPSGQYDAVLIDEGHDFPSEWLKLVVQMVDPRSNSLLVLYDDAQSIYEKAKRRDFSFKSVGIQAQGRTTILKVNYRNTQEILEFAANFARDVLTPSESGDDGIPRIAPVSAGRHGHKPLLVKLPSINEQTQFIANKLKEANRNGTPWKDMAVLYRHYDPTGKAVNEFFGRHGIPLTWKDAINFSEQQDTVKLLPFQSSKGLEYPLVAIPGADLLFSSTSEAPQDEAKLLYVAMTRATNTLIITGQELRV